MPKRGLLPAAIAALLVAPALAGATTLLPGVTYERQTRLIGGRPVVLHIVRTPPDGGLYQLRPVLSDGTVLGRRTVPSMQRGIAGRATTVGVNGDYFSPASGKPSGVFLRDGVLAARPHAGRSALAVAFNGQLLVSRFGLAGSWTAGSNPAHPLEQFNHRIDNPPGVGLFTRSWGGRTPRTRGLLEVVLGGFPKAVLNGNLTGTVIGFRRGGGTLVPPGGAILQARGFWRQRLLAEAPLGTPVTVRVRLAGFPDDAADAIGGGPALVANGVPIPDPDEWFTLDHLTLRHPRTAVGQLADGRLLFVVADGRSPFSRGLTTWQLAQTMAGLGAVTAMGLDGGGSSTLSFEGRVLNRPSDGVPRAVAEGLFVHYYGIYAPKVSGSVLSPNRDGVSDTKVVTAKVVRRSSVDLRLVRPNGTAAWRLRQVVGPGRIRRTVGNQAMPDGTWRWVVEATESRSGRTSQMTRTFTVNKTLGFLRLSKERMRVVRGEGGRLWVSVRLARRASLVVTVRKGPRTVRRILFSGEALPGQHAWLWNGRGEAGAVVETGTYTIRVRARNAFGRVTLEDTVRVVRLPAA